MNIIGHVKKLPSGFHNMKTIKKYYYYIRNKLNNYVKELHELWFPHQHAYTHCVWQHSVITGIPLVVAKKCQCGEMELTDAGIQQLAIRRKLQEHS